MHWCSDCFTDIVCLPWPSTHLCWYYSLFNHSIENTKICSLSDSKWKEGNNDWLSWNQLWRGWSEGRHRPVLLLRMRELTRGLRPACDGSDRAGRGVHRHKPMEGHVECMGLSTETGFHQLNMTYSTAGYSNIVFKDLITHTVTHSVNTHTTHTDKWHTHTQNLISDNHSLW